MIGDREIEQAGELERIAAKDSALDEDDRRALMETARTLRGVGTEWRGLFKSMERRNAEYRSLYLIYRFWNWFLGHPKGIDPKE